ncbi:putative bifunctional diguanylate cyclase/phosphodiesterase [Jannaschia sp. CCS1]|uniref:putative bifunctional diguanylate cyclase/phosphodiesterase n=1 Tax=Jannaschia sp. (strain CCS1) TaxID=290400 RepID=UPI000053C125|nr:GGDEF domain-containing phosphodiesterase [Jannaschia sp. CCS1]ABD55836.1 diguanylate cyclase/phosphodiesterase [Jannaschia sp. CCS1]
MDKIDQTPRIDQFAAARKLHTPIWLYDIDACRILHANRAACALWHARSEEELQNRDLAQDMSATVAKRLAQYKADFIARDATFNEMWTLFPDGVPTSVMVLFSGFRLLDGRMAMQCEVLGAPDPLPDNLRSAEALLHTDVMITLFREDGVPLYMNPAARNMVGEASAPLRDLLVTRTDYDTMVSGLAKGGEHRQVAEIQTKTGTRWFDISAKRCRDAATGDPAVLVTAIDVSELKRARDQARYLARRDQLTGCYNRSHLTRFVAELADAQATQVTLLYFDIDRFKQINDTYGHVIGDRVLMAMADRAIQLTQDTDAVVRLGGDEFVVVLGATDAASRLERVERFFKALSAPTDFASITVNSRVSLGVSVFDPTQTDVDVALRHADIALYLAKNTGRNRYVVYDDQMGEEADKRSRTEAEIESALNAQQFELYYQPRVDLASGRIVAVEGLARWRHPDRGFVPPDEFIPICEETGLIHLLGRRVLEMGFAQAIAWSEAGLDVQLSLNISPRQFSDPQLLDNLKAYADRPDFPTHKIELEITESVLIGDQDGIAAKLHAITAMGYQISIDDFGTGYSNLSYISRFPLHCLKIDRSFIEQLPASGPIVRLILALAQELGVTSVAEGVETQAQFDWLTSHGCTQIQGYFVAHPAPADDVALLLRPVPT